MKKTFLPHIFYTALLLVAATNLSAQGVISTIAGNGTAGYSGDGGSAIHAEFYGPSGVATDVHGNLYVADKYNSRVRLIDASSGIVQTFAGTGTAGYAGIGGSPLSAEIFYPNAMFVDHSGNVFFTDWYNDAAFKVSASTGLITNHCGHHTQGWTGDGGDASLATMEIPDGIWVDNSTGDAYIVDAGSNHLRKVSGATHIASTICGGLYGFSGDGGPAAAARFQNISGVCVDRSHNIYISDKNNNRIRKINTSGIVSTIAGTGSAGYTGDGGPATSAKINAPTGLFMTVDGFLFVCEEGNNVVRVINTNNGQISTLAGTGSAGFSGDGGLAISAKLSDPTSVWEDNFSGAIYIADAGNQRIRKIVGASYKGLAHETSAAANPFTIYPNPTSGAISISTAKVPDNCLMEVYNMLGVKVYSQSIAQELTNINLNVPQGIYTVLIKSAEGQTTKQISILK